MNKIIEKIKEISNYKYFVPIFVVIVNLIFFIICNLIFELKYETVDDFMMMKLISKVDGEYSIYGVFIHPVICALVMFLFKTGINVNWYTVFLLAMQFVAFCTIGINLINKNKKYGICFYLVIISLIYPQILTAINFTSTATVVLIAGVSTIMFDAKKSFRILGYCLISIGLMLRWATLALVIPFYIIYSIYNVISKREYKYINRIIILFFLIVLTYSTNLLIYNFNPSIKKYMQFNSLRSYFFDKNVLDYDKNKLLFEENNWSKNDYELFYTYSYGDENFYTTENLSNLKSQIHESKGEILEKIYKGFIYFYKLNTLSFSILLVIVMLLLLLALQNKKKLSIVSLIVIAFFALNYYLCFTKPVYRVIISLYESTIILILNVLIDDKKNVNNNKFEIIILIAIVLLTIFNSINIYNSHKKNNIQDYNLKRNIIDYASQNKQNAYVYTSVLGNISLAYNVYEKPKDNSFDNMRHMGDWDAYDKQYYVFKNKYNIDNIITDLYKKENLFLIDGDSFGADNIIRKNHIEIIIKYIKEHYNVDVDYKIIKEFENTNAKIYKLFEQNKSQY